jgi:hypothetical protein
VCIRHGNFFTRSNVGELKQYHFPSGKDLHPVWWMHRECPHDVPYHDLLRVVMYHDGYENDLLAKKF